MACLQNAGSSEENNERTPILLNCTPLSVLSVLYKWFCHSKLTSAKIIRTVCEISVSCIYRGEVKELSILNVYPRNRESLLIHIYTYIDKSGDGILQKKRKTFIILNRLLHSFFAILKIWMIFNDGFHKRLRWQWYFYTKTSQINAP